MKKYISALAVALCAALGLHAQEPPSEALILTYHTFLGCHDSSLDFSEDELAAQLDTMAGLGYTFVTLDDAVSGKITGTKNIVITLDDGNHSVYPAYKHVFKPRGIKPELFLPAKTVGHSRYDMTWQQVSELAADGCGLASHGYTHESLSRKAFIADEAKCMQEITKPAGMIEAQTGVRPTVFGYPFGLGSPKAQEAVEKEGYTWAFAADDQFVPVNFADAALNRMYVPRTIVYRWNYPRLVSWLEGKRPAALAGEPKVAADKPVAKEPLPAINRSTSSQ